MQGSQNLYLDGKWHAGDGEPLESVNPANGKVVWKGSATSSDQVKSAIAAARKAFDSWSSLPIDKRLHYLEAFRSQLEKHKDSLAQLISEEAGKPQWESKTEVKAMIGKIAISDEAYQERCPEQLREHPAGLAITRHKPHGVVAIFGPFNFPGHLPNGHIVPALLAGNTVIFKPSELTPAVGEKMVQLWANAGLPAGVLNLVQGGATTGKELASDNDLDGLFFTGSSRTGVQLSEQFGAHPGKILALEMGGNNPLIVSEVSDLQAAAYATVQSAYITSGQRCTCARRLIIEEGKKGDAFLAELIRMTKAIRVGPYTDLPEPFMGPLVSSHAAKQVLDGQATLIEKGAVSLVEATSIDTSTAFVTPGLLDVTAVTDRPDQEFFGPLLQVVRVKNFEEAIEEANHTRYGLSAGLLSDNAAKYETFRTKIRAGIVNWNTPITGASGTAPFGGTGLSGNHRPSAYYAADYCAYPVASVEAQTLQMPETLAPGLEMIEF